MLVRLPGRLDETADDPVHGHLARPRRAVRPARLLAAGSPGGAPAAQRAAARPPLGARCPGRVAPWPSGLAALPARLARGPRGLRAGAAGRQPDAERVAR